MAYKPTNTGWWFGPMEFWVAFHSVGNSSPNWRIPSFFTRGWNHQPDIYTRIYSDGLKLRMPGPFRTRCPKECRRGGKILKNPGKMQFSGTCNFTGTFRNDSFVGQFCENLQRNMRLSATHRMPPAKSPGHSMSNIWSPYFQNYLVYAGFYVPCAAHIECRQKHIQMSSFCCKISVLLWNTWFEGLYKFSISYE